MLQDHKTAISHVIRAHKPISLQHTATDTPTTAGLTDKRDRDARYMCYVTTAPPQPRAPSPSLTYKPDPIWMLSEQTGKAWGRLLSDKHG